MTVLLIDFKSQRTENDIINLWETMETVRATVH